LLKIPREVKSLAKVLNEHVMRIEFKCKNSPAGHSSPTRTNRPQQGHTFTEVLATGTVLGLVTLAFLGAFAMGSYIIHSARQNLSVSQIVMQRAESLRLFTASQVRDTSSYGLPLFAEPCDAVSGADPRAAAQCTGYITAVGPAFGGLPGPGHPHMRTVTVTLCWTNNSGAKPIVHARQIQACLARNGAPKYIWGAL
jgi:hypothetical protein